MTFGRERKDTHLANAILKIIIVSRSISYKYNYTKFAYIGTRLRSIIYKKG